jgi:hypothetical protein
VTLVDAFKQPKVTQQITRLALSTGRVIFSSNKGKFIGSVLKTGGSAIPVQDMSGTPQGLAVIGAEVYGADSEGMKIVHGPFDQFNFKTFDVSPSGPYWVVTDGTELFFDDCVMKSVLKMAPKQVTPTEIGMAVPCPADMVVDEDFVWTTDYEGGGVYRLPKVPPSSGATVAAPWTAATMQTWGLALSSTHVYFATSNGTSPITSKLYRSVKASAAPQELSSTVLINVTALAVDDNHLYFASAGTKEMEFADGSIGRLNLVSGKIETLATAQPRPLDIALDASSVYWVNAGSTGNGPLDTAVMKMGK